MPTFKLVPGINYAFLLASGTTETGEVISVTDSVATVNITGVQHMINLNLVEDVSLA